jgi:hypothetical protein
MKNMTVQDIVVEEIVQVQMDIAIHVKEKSWTGQEVEVEVEVDDEVNPQSAVNHLVQRDLIDRPTVHIAVMMTQKAVIVPHMTYMDEILLTVKDTLQEIHLHPGLSVLLHSTHTRLIQAEIAIVREEVDL